MKLPSHSRLARGFTLVELLTVMTIIGILAALVLGTFKFVQEKAARSRSEAEIKAMEAGLESFKADNGAYPDNSTTQGVNAATAFSPASYNNVSLILYRVLSGDTDLNRQVNTDDAKKDIYGGAVSPVPSPLVAPKIYFEFKPNQLLPTTTAAVTGLVDPWGNNYGYSTANQTTPSNGFNPTFDLWSTGGKIGNTPDDRAKWIKNW